jgi:hypothetical protein
MQIVGWTGGALVLGSVLMLLAWWAVVALVCRLGRQLLPLRAWGASRRPVAVAGVLPVEEAERAGRQGSRGRSCRPGHGDAAKMTSCKVIDLAKPSGWTSAPEGAVP